MGGAYRCGVLQSGPTVSIWTAGLGFRVPECTLGALACPSQQSAMEVGRAPWDDLRDDLGDKVCVWHVCVC